MSELSKLLEVITEVKNEMEKIDPSIKERLDYLPTPARVGLADLLTEVQKTLTFSDLPEIPISEIGWSSMNTKEGGMDIPSEQRAQLDQFLSNIRGNTLQEKVHSLSEFYSMNDDVIRKIENGKTSSEAIANVISYLTFYKTLTQIITHFNAASAGFSFESFLAVLMGGKQVPTNSQTIADMTDANGKPISLKLYKEGQLEVGGSYTDLVIDLGKDANKNEMEYVCVTKNLSGKEMQQEGVLRFLSFHFNLDNVFNIFANSKQKGSVKLILLPKPFLDSDGESTEGIPSKRIELPSPEELEVEYNDILDSLLATTQDEIEVELGQPLKVEELRQTLDYANNEDLFGKNPIRGKSSFSKMPAGLASVLLPMFSQNAEITTATKVKGTRLYAVAYAANEALVGRHKKGGEAAAERQEALNNLYFYDPNLQGLVERSRAFYEAASPEVKKKCLTASYGYVSTGHFQLRQKMVENVAELAQPTPGDLFNPGQSSVEIGRIEIGASRIEEVLNKVAEVLNENIFDIFNNLKSLTTNIQGYFAGGLSEDEKANAAQESAKNIEKKTGELKDQT
jgi:hypothetical protein